MYQASLLPFFTQLFVAQRLYLQQDMVSGHCPDAAHGVVHGVQQHSLLSWLGCMHVPGSSSCAGPQLCCSVKAPAPAHNILPVPNVR